MILIKVIVTETCFLNCNNDCDADTARDKVYFPLFTTSLEQMASFQKAGADEWVINRLDVAVRVILF